MSSLLPVPEKLNLKSGCKKKNWQLFHQAWQNYEVATKLSIKPNAQRLATLLTVIGQDALEVYNTFDFTEANNVRDIETVLSKFKAYCSPETNVTYERFVFLSRKQKSTESIDEFITDLKNLSSNCEFGAISESLIKDVMILGLHDDRLKEVLLREVNLTLHKAINIAHATENAKLQSSVLKREENNLFKVRSTNRTGHSSSESVVNKCKFCGTSHKFNRNNCPAFGKTCSKCKKFNHFAKQCFTKINSDNLNVVDNDSVPSIDDDLYIE